MNKEKLKILIPYFDVILKGILIMCVPMLVLFSMLVLTVNEEPHQNKYLESKNITHKPKKLITFYDEKGKIEYRKDSIDINMCFKMVTNDKNLKSYNLVCVCTCEEYKKNNK